MSIAEVRKSRRKVFKTGYVNNNDALIPELWAMESMKLLFAKLVMAPLVHRDFSPSIQRYGDVVNTRRPQAFTTKFKTKTDPIVLQSAEADNIPVKLNRHAEVSFMLYDADLSMAFLDLVPIYLEPAIETIAGSIDQCLFGRFISSIGNNAGLLGGMTGSNARQYFLDVRQVQDDKKAPNENRRLVIPPSMENYFLQTDLFTAANQRGDSGQTLATGQLGQTFNYGIYKTQNASFVSSGNTVVTGAINLSAGYAPGTTAFTVDGFSAAISNGTYFTIAGDQTPLRVTATTGGATPTVLTAANSPNKRFVANDAVVTVYTPGAVNNSGGYAAGYAKDITVNGFSVAPKSGQIVSFDTDPEVYTIIGTPTTTSITLDRPLDASISDTDKVNIGPAGSYGFAFTRNAVALVSRPLSTVVQGTGANSWVVNHGGYSLRVTISYDHNNQGYKVTVDTLFGTATLNADEGAVLFG